VGFYLLAGRVRTYAPRGQTPVLRVPLSREHLTMMGGLTAQGQLLLQVRTRAWTGAGVVQFLRYLRRRLPGKLLIIWDGIPIHRDHAVQAFVAEEGPDRLWVEQLPGYAPDLNPIEGIWHYLKQVELANLGCHDHTELRQQLYLAVARLRRKPAVIHGCIRQCGY